MNGNASNVNYKITVAGDPGEFACGSDQRVLMELAKTGASPVNVGCGGGGCGLCRVKVIEGQYSTLKMSRAHVSEEDEKQGFALSCRIIPESDLVLEIAAQQ